MSAGICRRGAVAVGRVDDLDPADMAAVLFLRVWSAGSDGPDAVMSDFLLALGTAPGQSAAQSFAALMDLCARFGRRPLESHGVMCACLGADEACFANLVGAAADGHREDAMLMATLLVRPDVAPMLADLAAEVGIALRRMARSASRAHSHAPGSLH